MARWVAYGLALVAGVILVVLLLTFTLLARPDAGRGEGRPPATTLP